MKKRKNCWEVKGCGREPGGENAKTSGVCPASLPGEYDALNGGKNAGRFCWAVAGTFCEGRVQGTYASKLENCLECKFLQQVNDEEGRNFRLIPNEEDDPDEI